MSFLRPGYWDRKYWKNSYWDINYWPGYQYGVIEEPSTFVKTRKAIGYKHYSYSEFIFEFGGKSDFYSATVYRKESIASLMIDEDLWLSEN